MSRKSYYLTNPQRRSLLGHISLGVSSYALSRKFYDATFSALDIDLIFNDPNRKILGYGPDSRTEVVNIFEKGEEARAPGAGTHIAFNAPNKKAVDEWYKAGIENGGKRDGEPGVREKYGANYYAAYLVDPDGWRLEAVFQDADGD
jgi:catechol 2,3-dioxygenase-like lactoylglutathione lyase family enzyme